MPNFIAKDKITIVLSFEESKKLDEIEEYFNFDTENSYDFEPWLTVFVNSLPREKFYEENYFRIFLETIYKLDDKKLKERMKKNEYLTFQEILPESKKQLSL